MFSELVVLRAMFGFLRARWQKARADETGGVAERVVLVALFVALAIVAGVIIYNKVVAKAKSIDFSTP